VQLGPGEPADSFDTPLHHWAPRAWPLADRRRARQDSEGGITLKRDSPCTATSPRSSWDEATTTTFAGLSPRCSALRRAPAALQAAARLPRSFGVRAPHRTAANSPSLRRPPSIGDAIRQAFDAVHSACPRVTMSSTKRRSLAAPIRSPARSPIFPERRYDIHSRALSVMSVDSCGGAPAPVLFATRAAPARRPRRAGASLRLRCAPRRPTEDDRADRWTGRGWTEPCNSPLTPTRPRCGDEECGRFA
jgi:hypothetical protein